MPTLKDVQTVLAKIETLLKDYTPIKDDSIKAYNDHKDLLIRSMKEDNITSQLEASNKLLKAIKMRAATVMKEQLEAQRDIPAISTNAKLSSKISAFLKSLDTLFLKTTTGKAETWFQKAINTYINEFMALQKDISPALSTPTKSKAPRRATGVTTQPITPTSLEHVVDEPHSLPTHINPQALVDESTRLSQRINDLFLELDKHAIDPWSKHALALWKEHDRLLASGNTLREQFTANSTPINGSSLHAQHNILSELEQIISGLDRNTQQVNMMFEAENAANRVRIEVLRYAKEESGKIQTMIDTPLYNTNNHDILVSAQSNIGKLIKSINTLDGFIAKLPRSTNETDPIPGYRVTNLSTELKAQIDQMMEPIRYTLETTKISVQQRITSLKQNLDAFEPLRQLDNAQLFSDADFNLPTSVLRSNDQLQRLESNVIISAPAFNQIEKLEHQFTDIKQRFAKFQLQQARKRTPEVAAMNIMKEQIEHQIIELSKGNAKDRRIALLKPILPKLTTLITDYCTDDKKTQADFVLASIDVLKDSFSGHKLNQLSDSIASPFIAFIRMLLKPIELLVNAFSKNTYKPQFFATNIETDLSQAAKRAHTSLDELKKTLDGRAPGEESPLTPPSR